MYLDAERIADQIMMERPNLDGSSSDSDDNTAAGNTAAGNVVAGNTAAGNVVSVHSGTSNFQRSRIPSNPRSNLQDQLQDLNLDIVPGKNMTPPSLLISVGTKGSQTKPTAEVFAAALVTAAAAAALAAECLTAGATACVCMYVCASMRACMRSCMHGINSKHISALCW